MAASGEINVFASPLPFSNLRVHRTAKQGLTIAEIVQEIKGDKAHLDAVVFINDHMIFADNWHVVRPKCGTVVNVRVIPHGGGGGKKSPITTLLSIAVLIAAPYIAGAMLGSTLAATSVLGGLTTYGGLLSGAIGIVGKLAISALSPPPKQSSGGGGGGLNPAESPTQFVEGARNALSPFGVVPICLGTNRMVPPQAARPYQETAGNDQFVRQLFTYGWGQNIQITDLKLGETPIAEFSDVEIEHRLNGDLHQSTGLYSNDVFQEDYSLLLSQVDGFSTRTTQAAIDEATIDFTFPSGLTQFNESGTRINKEVILEVQYSPAGAGTWSTGTGTYDAFTGTTITPTPAATPAVRASLPSGTTLSIYRLDVIVLDLNFGTISIIQGTNESETLDGVGAAPPVPSGKYRLAFVMMFTTIVKGVDTAIISNTSGIHSLSDARQPSDFGGILQNSGSFAPSQSGASVVIASGGLKTLGVGITAAQTEALRVSRNIKFPSNGQYDIRVRRNTPDSASDQIIDLVYLTAIKSIKHVAPVALQGINGTAIRIRGTNQLNGGIDDFNVIASNVIPDYDPQTDSWINRATSNPASIFRYVLQSAANYRPLPDSRIRLDDLKTWHTYCADRGYTYNRVIDYDVSLYDVLKDVASAGAAAPTIFDGKFSVVVDKEKPDIVQVVTPRNSWGYSAELVYPDIPHAFRIQFRNSAKGYVSDERIVYDDGFTEANATKFEQLEYQSCTNSDLAFKHGRRHIATARLRPVTHQFTMDVENIVMTRGDRIKLAHDVPIIGVGSGRVKTITDNGTHITAFTFDDVGEFIAGRTYYARIRKQDGTTLYLALAALSGFLSSVTLATPLLLASGFAIGDICYFVEAGGEVDLIVTRIEPQNDLSARITAVDYAPAIFTAETIAIPAWTSNASDLLSFMAPEPPVLAAEPQSDETLMTRNSDGSFTSRMAITLINNNDADVEPIVLFRQTGATYFARANVLEASPERVVITGLQDGISYDVHIRYRRIGYSVNSLPLQINGYRFIGATGTPSDVSTFRANIVGNVINLNWTASPDIDISHYSLRFSRAFSSVTWESAQTIDAVINETRITLPFIGGTYLIKAVDLLGNESANATTVVTYADTQTNVVAVLTENPSFAGTKDNVLLQDGALILADTSIDGYYYFANDIDLTAVFTSQVSATITAGGAYTNNVFDMPDVFAVADMFGLGNNDVFEIDDIFAVDDVFGIAVGSWDVQLQTRTTMDDPTGTPTWSAWQDFSAGDVQFWGAEYRLRLRSFAANITPSITVASVTIDMPDRVERGNDLAVGVGGVTITFSPAFKAEPSLAILLQDGATDDRIEFTSKTAAGFTFKVYNATLAAYVARTFDYIASGYGRVE